MIDIHCHLIYGIDDGARDRETALNMLRNAAADGVEGIVCTPHFSPVAYRRMDAIREELRAAASEQGIALYAGMEYDYNHLLLDVPLRPLAGSNFLLLDFCASTLPAGWETILGELQLRNFRIIAAHPERLFRTLEPVRELASHGVCFQLTAESFLGRYGRRCARFAFQLLQDGFCDYIASDAHDNCVRGFHLSECRRLLSTRIGVENVRRIFEHNPAALLKGDAPERMVPAAARGFWRNLRVRFRQFFFRKFPVLQSIFPCGMI